MAQDAGKSERLRIDAHVMDALVDFCKRNPLFGEPRDLARRLSQDAIIAFLVEKDPKHALAATPPDAESALGSVRAAHAEARKAGDAAGKKRR